MNTYDILYNPFLNKGTAFTVEERQKLGLIGLLPPYVQTIEEQAAQTYAQMKTKASYLEKRLFLMEIFNTNRTLFYYLFSQHLEEFNPIVYDPTIAETIEGYSNLFINTQNAGYLDINHPENIETTLKNAAGDRQIRLIVVTDAEEILGIGDWGTKQLKDCSQNSIYIGRILDDLMLQIFLKNIANRFQHLMMIFKVQV